MNEKPYLYKKFIGFLVGVDLDSKEAIDRIPRQFRLDKKDVKETLNELINDGTLKQKIHYGPIIGKGKRLVMK